METGQLSLHKTVYEHHQGDSINLTKSLTFVLGTLILLVFLPFYSSDWCQCHGSHMTAKGVYLLLTEV